MPQVKNFKVAWIDADDSRTLRSAMYDTLAEAERNAPADAMIMQLITANETTYSWKLLPYGSGKHIETWWSIYQHLYLVAAVVVLSVVAAVVVGKK